MSAKSIIEQEYHFGAHHYKPLPIVVTRAAGVYVWDVENKQYLDLMSAYSALSHGHCHPQLVSVLIEQAHKLALISRAFYSDKLAAFLQMCCEVSEQDMALPMNTGAEAVETALKAARKWAYTVKGVAADQAEIIVCRGNFHGRTIAITAMSSEAQYRNGFGPFPAGFKIIPYADVNALREAVTDNTAAFLVEPIQGEAGINIPPAGYLKACSEVCRERNVLLICDEIQTGLARTGKLFAYQHEQIKPDGLILGKALGGGLLPVSMFLARRDVMSVFTPGDHGSTFGGNPLAASVGLAALEIMVNENYAARSAQLGEYFLRRLQSLQSSIIQEVRGRGLLIGLEINKNKISARAFCEKLAEYGVLTKDTHHTVVRLAPPLIITEQQIDEVLLAIEKTIAYFEAQ